jgi:hypothetical protein
MKVKHLARVEKIYLKFTKKTYKVKLITYKLDS